MHDYQNVLIVQKSQPQSTVIPLVEKSDEYQREENFIIPIALPVKRERYECRGRHTLPVI